VASEFEHARALLEEHDLAHVLDDLEEDREIVLHKHDLLELRKGGCIAREGVSITYD
jgi:hypothetical protein